MKVITTGQTKDKVEKPSEGKYTKQSRNADRGI